MWNKYSVLYDCHILCRLDSLLWAFFWLLSTLDQQEKTFKSMWLSLKSHSTELSLRRMSYLWHTSKKNPVLSYLEGRALHSPCLPVCGPQSPAFPLASRTTSFSPRGSSSTSYAHNYKLLPDGNINSTFFSYKRLILMFLLPFCVAHGRCLCWGT